MTSAQIRKKCEIARKTGEAYLPSGDCITYYSDTQEYALHSAWKRQTICVTYKVDYIVKICEE